MTRIRIKRVYEAAGAGRRLPRAGRQALAAGRTQRRPALRRLGQGPCAFGPDCAAGITPTPGDRWEEFRRRYTDELRASQAVREFVRGIEGVDTVTLLYASKNAAENHALILQEYLQRAAGGATTA